MIFQISKLQPDCPAVLNSEKERITPIIYYEPGTSLSTEFSSKYMTSRIRMTKNVAEQQLVLCVVLRRGREQIYRIQVPSWSWLLWGLILWTDFLKYNWVEEVLWWSRFRGLVLRNWGRFQCKISDSLWRADAATSCVV